MKTFISEPGREAVVGLLTEATLHGTSRMSYVECCAAFARARRSGGLTPAGEVAARRALDGLWPMLAVVELDESLMRTAARLTRGQDLRAADAVQLASGLVLAQDDPADVTFACWDRRLWVDASGLGFKVLPPEQP